MHFAHGFALCTSSTRGANVLLRCCYGGMADWPIFTKLIDVLGAGGRSRTLDLRITNALLYQLSYTGFVF